MKKQLITILLFFLAACSIVSAEEIAPIPYEKFIAQEYNRLRAGADKYTSFHKIMNQSLRGKPTLQKHKIIDDLQALKLAVNSAYWQAERDGKSLWYYGYLWKDNNPAIQALIQHEDDINHQLATYKLELESDIVKFIRYITPFTSGIFAGIVLLWLTQGNLSYEYYLKYKQHGIFEMLASPIKPMIPAWDIFKAAEKIEPNQKDKQSDTSDN